MGWVVSSIPRPLLPLGKTRYPLYKRLGGPQGRYVRVQKISPPTRIRRTNCTLIFKKISQVFFPYSMFLWLRDKKIVFIPILLMQLWRMKNLNFLRTKKYSLERQCEWNWPVLWLFHEMFACYFATVSIEWSLHSHSEHWQHFLSAFPSLVLGQMELTWVQNGPVELKKMACPRNNIHAV